MVMLEGQVSAHTPPEQWAAIHYCARGEIGGLRAMLNGISIVSCWH